MQSTNTRTFFQKLFQGVLIFLRNKPLDSGCNVFNDFALFASLGFNVDLFFLILVCFWRQEGESVNINKSNTKVPCRN